jgi:hypothetical protein
MYFVSRQHYYYQNILVVEISYPTIDYSGPDMLVSKYPQLGEGESFNDPREALKSAIKIRDQWQKDLKEKDSFESVIITCGSFDGCEGEESEDKELITWANQAYQSLEKCALCGDILEENSTFINEDSEFTEEKFCCEQHAERAYLNSLEICLICEKDFTRKDMNYDKDERGLICDSCLKEKEEKCALCGDILEENSTFINEDSEFTEEKFCSENHSDLPYLRKT